MRYETGEEFAYATNSAAATCSFSLTAATRNIKIRKIDAASDLSGAVVTVDASGTTLWKMQLGSASVPGNFNGLNFDIGNAQTLSCNITASALGAYIALCGTYRYI